MAKTTKKPTTKAKVSTTGLNKTVKFNPLLLAILIIPLIGLGIWYVVASRAATDPKQAAWRAAMTFASCSTNIYGVPADIKLGSTGGCVAATQRMLNFWKNAPGVDDVPSSTVVQNGQYDVSTESLVKQFQTAYGLPADGIVGATTWLKFYGCWGQNANTGAYIFVCRAYSVAPASILFSASDGGIHSATLPLSAASDRTIGYGYAATHSMDNTKIAYTDTYSKSLYIMNNDGTNIKLLATFPTQIMDIHWSPDGQRIAFAYAQGTDLNVTNLGSIATDGSGKQVALSTSPGRLSDFNWSPDGSRISYTYFSPGAAMTSRNIYVANSDGSNKRVVVSNANGYAPFTISGSAYWLDNNSLLLYSAGSVGNTGTRYGDLVKVDLGTLAQTFYARPSVLPAGQGALTYTIAPDRTKLLFTTSTQDPSTKIFTAVIYTYNFSTKATTKVVTLVGASGQNGPVFNPPTWSNTSGSIVYNLFKPVSPGSNTVVGTLYAVVDGTAQTPAKVSNVNNTAMYSWRTQ